MSSGFSIATMTRAASINFSQVLPRLCRWIPVRAQTTFRTSQHPRINADTSSARQLTVMTALPDISAHLRVAVAGAQVHLSGKHEPQIILSQSEWVGHDGGVLCLRRKQGYNISQDTKQHSADMSTTTRRKSARADVGHALRATHRQHIIHIPPQALEASHPAHLPQPRHHTARKTNL